MCKFHPASPSKFTETPSSTTISAAQILSNIQLPNWRGSMTTFKGFTGTRADQEFEDIPWTEVCNLMCPDKPAIIADKKQGQYVLPCLLKDAPLVGHTLEAAIKNGESTTGKMRSKSHVTAASMLIIDIDGLSKADYETGLAQIRSDGLTYLAYSTHSYGNPDKPGIRVRLIVPLDHHVNTDDYAAA